MKVVLNGCYGGFGLSALAVKKYYERKGQECYFFSCDWKQKGEEKYSPITLEQAQDIKKIDIFMAFDIPDPNSLSREEECKHHLDTGSSDRDFRSDPDLIAVVEELGDEANGQYAELRVIEIPDDAHDWRVDEYDGMESIAEGRTWY